MTEILSWALTLALMLGFVILWLFLFVVGMRVMFEIGLRILEVIEGFVWKY